MVSIDQTNWSQLKLNSFSFPTIISGVHNLSAMHLLLDLNSTANFLITTRRLLIPQLISLSIRVIESSAITRQFLGPRLHFLQLISMAYPGLIDLELCNTKSDTHDFFGWSSELSTLNLRNLQRLVLHSAPVPLSWNSWNILDVRKSWILPSLRHLSMESGYDLWFQETVGQLFGPSLLTLSIRTSLVVNLSFWTTFSALQELEIARSSLHSVSCDSPPPALHPIRRVIIRGAWPSNPDEGSMHIVDRLFNFTDQPSPVEWLICDDDSINALDRTQWQHYKETILFHAGYRTRPEVCQHVVEKWVTGEDRDDGNPHRLALSERS